MPFGPPLGELRDEWDRTPDESIAKIHGTKKQSKKWTAASFFDYAINQAGGIISDAPLGTNRFERQAAEEKGWPKGWQKRA
jgi:hypothetical protein